MSVLAFPEWTTPVCFYSVLSSPEMPGGQTERLGRLAQVKGTAVQLLPALSNYAKQEFDLKLHMSKLKWVRHLATPILPPLLYVICYFLTIQFIIRVICLPAWILSKGILTFINPKMEFHHLLIVIYLVVLGSIWLELDFWGSGLLSGSGLRAHQPRQIFQGPENLSDPTSLL